ncbi:nuclear transport factor 2 family protein [Benzoatithermus flavus]|uniref:Nuclear transport factor 2 family protein n=1 Tax=Benzoatithermus flavus TaxID=3108223 RepID=A0ABU8XUE7_9PROT
MPARCRSLACAALMLAATTPVPAARAGASEEVRTLYGRFLAAQNARDLARVRSLLLDSPKFLWVSDGMAVWGPDALVERMSLFQQAPVWRVDPDLAKAVPVELDDRTAYLHLPLVLTIGPEAAPDRLHFLVSMLGVATPEGWRIAALFTTAEKPR